ncbi:SRPBCC domain-containing protein [Iamia sp. SCSIO 61187]|uniref:SRPBCC family protein n=1 Tax=Iamia sp. SCSIO 61187 TaxID=2722752 RepID=UPI001C6293E8|nr:SRPBCC domain-containing protein [Iamia sp. SCSIO 61187]QYG91856.1 SRPBCC domain-containing protein [Iamia sp. SCSIO 61187]
MITQMLRRKKELHFERSYPAPVEAVWRAWTEADRLRQWWGPDKTTIAECEIDLRVGGRISVVTVASEEMGKYAGTRWPMEGTFTRIDERRGLTYEARSWTEGEEDTATIRHTNDLTLTGDDDSTTVTLHVTITEIGPKAKLAAFGMKWGYKAQLDALEEHLAS